MTTNLHKMAPVLALLALGLRLIASCTNEDAASPALSQGGAGGGQAGSGAGQSGGGSTSKGGYGQGGVGQSGAGQGGAGMGGTGNAGGCSGYGGGSATPICQVGMAPATLTYFSRDPACEQPVAHTMQCAKGCEFRNPAAAQCVAEEGVLPFSTCELATDCGNVNYCLDGTHVRHLGQPTCVEGACQWQAQTSEECQALCVGSECLGASGGGPPWTTSGGFQWQGLDAVCVDRFIVYSYYDNAGQYHASKHECQKDCYADATGVGCDQATGEAPAHSCSKNDVAACPGVATQCVPSDPTSILELTDPVCDYPFYSCSWKTTTKKACPAGTTCQGSACAP
jgi:hypothetical protein